MDDIVIVKFAVPGKDSTVGEAKNALSKVREWPWVIDAWIDMDESRKADNFMITAITKRELLPMSEEQMLE